MVTTARKTEGTLPSGLTVDEFLAWAKDRLGRFELHDGQIIAMSPERIGNVAIKGRIYRALGDAIAKAKLPCHALPDGAAIRIDDKKWYEPDALIYCGEKAAADELRIEHPIIVVEVVSPSTAQLDETSKLIGYFSLASIQHYLIIYPEGLPLVHHRRQSDGSILTTIISNGKLSLNPPGLELDVLELFSV